MSGQAQKGFLTIRKELVNFGGTTPQERLDGRGRAVAKPHPNDFRRVSFEETPLTEVSILGDDCEAMLGSVLPDRGVGGFSKPNLTDVNRVRETIRKTGIAKATDFDRRAASRRYARQSPLTICGKGKASPDVLTGEIGEIVQDLVLGHARSEIVEHVVYRHPHPRMQGLPPIFPGSMVMILR